MGAARARRGRGAWSSTRATTTRNTWERVAAHGPVALVLLTHRHHDHAAGARRFAQLTGAPVRALDPSLVLGSEALGEGDVVAAAG